MGEETKAEEDKVWQFGFKHVKDMYIYIFLSS